MANTDLEDALGRMGLLAAGEHPVVTPLAGGVASDILRVDLASGPVCVKRALARLKVAAVWEVPVERNGFEVAWMETASAVVPGVAPGLHGHDPDAGLFVMEFLSPERFPVWKEQLRQGIAETDTARRVGERLVRVHAGTADRPHMAERFPTDYIFHPIRLEPYLLATARAHPDRAAALEALVETTATTKRCLVHGDVSPKNILVGPDGPLFLDAECAWYGDPAFDVAFCLNHMLLKCLWTPNSRCGFLACFDALAGAYLAGVDWEPVDSVEARIARLLPGLLLGRVDGKSPAEYLTGESDKNRVRRVARALLAEPVDRLARVREAWKQEIQP